MLKRPILISCIAGFMLTSFTINNQVVKFPKEKPLTNTSVAGGETFLLNAQKSIIQWIGKGVGKEHDGGLKVKSGNVVVDTKQIKSGFIYIDMKSLSNNDVKDAGFNKQLCDHLKSADFFNTPKYPDATFKIVKATRLDVPNGEVNYTITGDLTIKRVKNTIDVPAIVTFAKKTVNIKADLSIDRTKWDIKYNSGNYFQDLGDKLIEDEVTLKFDLVADIK